MGRSESRIAHIMKEYRSKIGETDGKVVFENADKGDIFDGRTLRVCAYCRVSTDNDEQLTSFELQQEHYAKLVGTHDNWNLIRIYADEGISGTSVKHREDFNQMIEDCRAGKYDEDSQQEFLLRFGKIAGMGLAIFLPRSGHSKQRARHRNFRSDESGNNI